MSCSFAYAAYVCDQVVTVSPPTTGFEGYLNALWMTIVTMTTVGYGSVTPHTYFGRGIMTATSLISMVLFGIILNQVIMQLSPCRTERRLAWLVNNREVVLWILN